MSKFRIIKYSILFFVSFLSTICANEDKIKEALENIFRYARSSIDLVEEGKIFLKSEKVCFHQGKIYVASEDGEAIAIPCIFSSTNGLYIQTNEFNIFDFFGMWQCQVQGCKYWNSRFVDTCQNCHTPRG